MRKSENIRWATERQKTVSAVLCASRRDVLCGELDGARVDKNAPRHIPRREESYLSFDYIFNINLGHFI